MSACATPAKGFTPAFLDKLKPKDKRIELAELFYTRRILPYRKRPDVVRVILDNDVIPKLGSKKLATLSTPVVASIIESVVDRGAKTHAGSVLSVTKQMFRFAEGHGYMDRSPAYSLDGKDLGIEPHIAEKRLNHSMGKIEHSYNRNALAENRREALQKWADFVDLTVTDRDNKILAYRLDNRG